MLILLNYYPICLKDSKWFPRLGMADDLRWLSMSETTMSPSLREAGPWHWSGVSSLYNVPLLPHHPVSDKTRRNIRELCYVSENKLIKDIRLPQISMTKPQTHNSYLNQIFFDRYLRFCCFLRFPQVGRLVLMSQPHNMRLQEISPDEICQYSRWTLWLIVNVRLQTNQWNKLLFCGKCLSPCNV